MTDDINNYATAGFVMQVILIVMCYAIGKHVGAF